MPQTELPSFAKPPVVETILGLQFEPIPGFTNAHLGAFWAKLGGRKNWPHVVDANTVRQEFERFGEDQQWQQADTITLGFATIAATRMQVRNASRDRLLQLQNGRLIYNWTGVSGAEYARYNRIRSEFDAHTSDFKQFLAEQELPAFRPNQWEITYINHLPKGTVWNDVSDWRKLFSFSAIPSTVINECSLESFGDHWVYEIGPRRGRLRMQLHHARNDAQQEVLVFNLTARGPVGEGEAAVANVEAGLDLGHATIVRTFAELTSPQARRYWEEHQ